MWHANKEHWRIWFDYAALLSDARELAAATGHPITSRPWDGGWVIFNLRNLHDLKCELAADEADSNHRYWEAKDSGRGAMGYDEAEYTRLDLISEADEYLKLIDSFN